MLHQDPASSDNFDPSGSGAESPLGVPQQNDPVDDRSNSQPDSQPDPQPETRDNPLEKLDSPKRIPKKTLAEEIEFLRSLSKGPMTIFGEPNGKRVVSAEERKFRKMIVNYRRFQETAKPLILKGRDDIQIVAYSGLSTTNHPLRGLLCQLYMHYGFHTAIHSLAGFDGTYEGMYNVTADQMISELREHVQQLPKTPEGSQPAKRIFVGFSTGAAAGVALEGLEPGTFDAMVLFGMPRYMKIRLDEMKLALCDSIEARASKMGAPGRWLVKKLHDIEHAMNSDYCTARNIYSKDLSIIPHFRELRGKTLLAYYRVLKEGRRALDRGRISLPIFAAEGDGDWVAAQGSAASICRDNKFSEENWQANLLQGHRFTPEHFDNSLYSDNARKLLLPHLNVSKTYPDSPHPIWFSGQRHNVEMDLVRYVGTLIPFLAPDISIPPPGQTSPRFKKSLHRQLRRHNADNEFTFAPWHEET